MDVDLGFTVTLQPEKAIAYFESKGYTIGFNWHDVKDSAHATAFTVSGILKLDVLTDISTAQANALKEGKSQAQFKNELLPELARKGWIGKGLKASPDGELTGAAVRDAGNASLSNAWLRLPALLAHPDVVLQEADGDLVYVVAQSGTPRAARVSLSAGKPVVNDTWMLFDGDETALMHLPVLAGEWRNG